MFFDTEANYNLTFAPQVAVIYKYTSLDPQENGVIEFIVNFDPDYSTACFEKIWCSSEDRNELPLSYNLYMTDTSFYDKHLADLKEDTFFEPNATWTYETLLEYRCPIAMAFEDNSTSQKFECKWDGNWDQSPWSLQFVGKHIPTSRPFIPLHFSEGKHPVELLQDLIVQIPLSHFWEDTHSLFDLQK